ncbi:hypothetical protein L798_08573 [Zootermopsis nevadensis]|uniref:MADF domain-containing protein n=1 Tax=Zootermopsis nevadensis TaxID=136037 RepID=A0A067RC75_ZOONE|nr:hypothetical protein L798_08573 [Zootermopsis nevadensis]
MDGMITELLITLVEERHKTLESHKDKKLKECAWREICVALKENFDELEQKQRQEFGKFYESMEKDKEQKKSDSSAKPSGLYVFHEQLSFLNKITETTDVHESCHNNEQEETTLRDVWSKGPLQDYNVISENISRGATTTGY